MLRERGVKTTVFDVSVTAASEIIAAAFRYSHLVLAAPTYNAGIFVKMEDLLHDLVAHNLRRRTVAVLDNGSWAATAGKQMRQLLAALPETTLLDETVSLRSALTEAQLPQLTALADVLAASVNA